MLDQLIDLVGEVRDHRSGIATALWSEGTVVTHLDPGADPVGADSLFEIGSVTKTMTATLLAFMVGRGTVRACSLGWNDALDQIEGGGRC